MPRPPRYALLAASVLALWGCPAATCPTPPAAETGHFVRGRVASADAPEGKPLEQAEVWVADVQGNPITGVMHARTDKQGDFLAANLPPGHAYVLVARGPGPDGTPQELKTLAKPGTDPNAFQDLSPASTILTTALTKDRVGLPGSFPTATFDAAVALIEAKLGGSPAPALADASAVVAWLDARKAEDAALKALYDELAPQVAGTQPRERAEAAVRPADADPLDALKPIY